MPETSYYNIYVCKVHHKTIYYFKTDEYITGFWHCWECAKEHNDNKNKDANTTNHSQ